MELIAEAVMALIMTVVEVLAALIAPAAEVAAPFLILLVEALVWLVLLLVQLVLALIYWRKLNIPGKPQFNGLRGKLKSFSIQWRKRRENKKARKQSS
ncbi:hypothetical protein GNX18_07395 [Microbulbifer sp. SH-1]|uniref:hypothetical protein n=1 Tax=Microbulbifer sp. SH-1 TaxID=2681547 RepID=UPI001409BF07|nr:hypothetical protein [Microbulbifer sp. SH-1]QIL89595.1 hypothetical protein GNX18_07395 [Microbulbifer sp. SH-1]